MADLTYLMNADPVGKPNQFYSLAKQYFVAAGSIVVDAPTKGQTFEGIFNDLKARKTAQGTINIVGHAEGLGAMQGAITLADQAKGTAYIFTEDLQNAMANKTLAPPGPGIITDKTRVVLYGCDVGRSLNFLKLLSGLFGDPGELLGPRRLSVFKLDGSAVKHRQAQSWTVVQKAPLIPSGASAPTVGWPAYRKQFVKDASDKFSLAAIAAEIGGDTRLTTILTTAASSATTTFAPTFFLEEGMDFFAGGTQTAKQVADAWGKHSNGDPVTATAQSVAQVDDTTVVTTFSGADAYPANAAKTQYSISLVLLAQIIDQDVPIAEGPGFARVTSSKALAPSTGPKSTGSGTGSGGGSGAGAGASNQIQTLVDQLLADGAAQADVDDLVALIPTAGTTEAALDPPDDAISDTDDGIALLLPSPLEVA
jgi:hypothetical protein